VGGGEGWGFEWQRMMHVLMKGCIY
jgi:hypothetical protein